MSVLKNKIITGISPVFLSGVLLAASLLPISASANYHNYAPRTQAEEIAYLHGVISQLLLQLQSQQGFLGVNYQPSGGVLGTSISMSRQQYDIEVHTDYLRIDDDDVYLNGTIDLDGAQYADVWFEYDTDKDDFDERTRKYRVYEDGRFTIKVDKDEFDENEWYNYRAVGESSSGDRDRGGSNFLRVSDRSSRSSNDDEPDANTNSARDIDENSAELRGSIDMNDFRNGIVFFVYGEDEDQVEDIEREYDEFRDIDEDGDDLQKVRVDSDLDGDEDYVEDIKNLDDDTEYFFQICVEYEDEDDDETIECGGVEDFETDRD